MNAAFIRIGLSACDIGVCYFLPRMIGASAASEFMLTGRFIDAARGRELGLLSTVVEESELDATARGFVKDMLHATPLGLRLTKEALNFAIDAQSLEAAIAMEDRNQILCGAGRGFRRRHRAFLEKREPKYGGEVSHTHQRRERLSRPAIRRARSPCPPHRRSYGRRAARAVQHAATPHLRFASDFAVRENGHSRRSSVAAHRHLPVHP